MKEIFLYSSAFLAFISSFFYIVSIFRKKTKPHRTTRFVIFLISIVNFFSLLAAHSQTAVWLSSMEALQSVFMFAFSIRYGMGGWSKSDILCLFIALIGIYLWQTTNDPIYGLCFAILADFTGFVPTYIKTYKLPETEYSIYYLFGFSAALVNLFALQNFVFKEYAYPVYILFSNLFMIFLINRIKILKSL